MSNTGFADNLFGAFLNWLYSTGDITVPGEFHARCAGVEELIDNDISGVINTVLDYAISSAAKTNYKVQCSNSTLEELLNAWLEEININISGIPTGLQELSREYFKERWEGSSLCVLRVKGWKKIGTGENTIEVPTIMWYPNGASIYVKRDKNYKLGSDKYYLDKENKILLPEGNLEQIVVQKPFDRWFDQYATPYLIRKGVYKNWLAMKVLQEKSDEVISKILPYLFIIKKGTERLFIEGETSYDDKDLKKVVDGVKVELEKYKNQKSKTPTTGQNFDTEFEHLIPDLRKILTEDIYKQGFRSILSGLGFIDMLEIGSSRQETRINPKPFIAEINNGVDGFKSMLLDVIYAIIKRNKDNHPKFFGKNNDLTITNSPLKINVEQMLEAIRSGYDRGVLSIESYTETLGFDFDTEKERRIKELENGYEDLMYPHLIQNREDIPDRGFPAKPRNEKNEDQNKQKNTPEAENFKADKEDLIMAPYTMENHPKYLDKYPKHAIEIWVTTFNEVLKNTGDESKAFPIAWNALKRYMKKLKSEETK